jgi:hypothetical protein
MKKEKEKGRREEGKEKGRREGEGKEKGTFKKSILNAIQYLSNY